MRVIFAEKRDMGRRIAAALDCIRFPDGKTVSFADLDKHDKAISALQTKQGYFDITFNGAPARVTWGLGHLCVLKHAQDYNPDYKFWPNLPVPFIPNPFELLVRDEVKSHFKIVSKLFNSASLIINAGDPDREGEVIFAYIYEMSKCKVPYKRAWFSETTKPGIQKGFSKLKTAAEMKPLEQAGRARGLADWLVGSNLTAQMTLKHKGMGVLSIGRVQTPVLNMIVKRELEIKNFKPTDFWKVLATFNSAAGEYVGTHKTDRFDTEAEALKVISEITGKPATISDINTSKFTKEPPHLYSLTTLQMDANEIYGLTLTETLESAQRLYEGGHVTYPRTDSQFLNDDMWPDVQNTLAQLEKMSAYNKYLSGKPRVCDMPRYFDSSKVSSHYAIIPTDNPPKAFKHSHDERVYDLIAKSLIRIIYPKAVANRTRVITSVAGHDFISTGSTILDLGWLAVDGKTNEKFLPSLKKGETVSGIYSADKGVTQPPRAYNDKSIVAAMETAGKDLPDAELRKILASKDVGGIGRPATRATIIQTLEQRKYIERKSGKSIRATELGIMVIEKLPCEALKSAELTAQWEKRLTLIADSKENYANFMKDICGHLHIWVDEIVKSTPSSAAGYGATGTAASSPPLPCPLCGANVRKLKWGWGCTGYSAGCKFSISGVIAQKTLTDKQAETLILKGHTNKINGFTKKDGKKFSAALVLDGGKVTFG